MKVLIVNKFLHPNGGSETYIFGLGAALQRLGHEVQYFGMDHEGRCVGNAVNSYTSDMDFHNAGALKKVSYSLKTIYSVEARKKIRLVLDDFKPDVVHLNNFNYQLTPSVILEIVKWRKQNNCQCKILYTAHDYQLLCPNHMFNNPATHENCEKCMGGKLGNCIKGKCIHGSILKSVIGSLEAYYWNLRGTYKYIDKIICCSEFMKSKMDTTPLFAGKTIAVHNFVEKVPYSADNDNFEKKDSDISEPYILYFGRLSWEKGVRTLLEACKKLTDVHFVFAGRGEYAEEIRNLSNAKYVGFKTGIELDSLIRNALFTITPSVWYENNPFSVMESQERLTPVLGARIGGIPELIEEDISGWLFESGDVEDLTKRICTLYHDQQRVEMCRKNLKNLNRLNADDYAKTLLDIAITGI